MLKLTDTQAILLSTAAQRSNGSLLPLPATISVDASQASKAIGALIKRGYANEAPDVKPDQAWRIDGDLRFGAVVTDVGRTAIGIEPDCAPSALQAGERKPNAIGKDTARSTKTALVLSLLRREQGATLAELVEATGWRSHTTRAALTGIRRKGHVVAKGKRESVTCYTLVA